LNEIKFAWVKQVKLNGNSLLLELEQIYGKINNHNRVEIPHYATSKSTWFARISTCIELSDGLVLTISYFQATVSKSIVKS